SPARSLPFSLLRTHMVVSSAAPRCGMAAEDGFDGPARRPVRVVQARLTSFLGKRYDSFQRLKSMCVNCIPTQTCVAAEERVTAPGGSPFAGDSWSNWEPDPQRAFRENDPSLEPYALMSREEVIQAM